MFGEIFAKYWRNCEEIMEIFEKRKILRTLTSNFRKILTNLEEIRVFTGRCKLWKILENFLKIFSEYLLNIAEILKNKFFEIFWDGFVEIFWNFFMNFHKMFSILKKIWIYSEKM